MVCSRVAAVTETIIVRSRDSRAAYLSRVNAAAASGPYRGTLSCGNLAHGIAACGDTEKSDLIDERKPNIAIISAYNDMLSAHQPYRDVPEKIKAAIASAGGVAQFAGGVPAMCDGVTQGQAGMELSLFSRDVIALATGVALSHNMFDGGLYLGVCDKIVPGLLIGALSFGHLPAVFIPAGPMPSGLPNPEKQRVRQLYAEGKVGRDALLKAESESYHSPGTCTFYGTANSNQMLVEMMGLHLPGSSFINPNTLLRDALTEAAAQQVLKFTGLGEDFRPLAEVIDERTIVNAMVGLLTTGGSTNHSIHLIAIARAAGIEINWEDFDQLSKAVPLLSKIYPNGDADINHFQAAGGMSVLIHCLLEAELIHDDTQTIYGDDGLAGYTVEPVLESGDLTWRAGPLVSGDSQVIASVKQPFAETGGLNIVRGNLGRGVIKVSAVAAEHRVVTAPAVVFDDQNALLSAFKAGELQRDFIAVLRFQGPKANGMPELHKLTPTLAVLQEQGFKVALVTDGRMSGASGKVAAAIHMSPECADGGPLAKVRSGDMIRLDSDAGRVDLLVDEAELASRIPAANLSGDHSEGCGRELFTLFRTHASSAETGASVLF